MRLHNVVVRIISVRNLRFFWEHHRDAEAPLRQWLRVAERSRWANFLQLRATFPQADQVRVASGNTVTVFNIHGNDYRLIASVKYRKHLIYTLWVMTHAEYSRDQWKGVL